MSVCGPDTWSAFVGDGERRTSSHMNLATPMMSYFHLVGIHGSELRGDEAFARECEFVGFSHHGVGLVVERRELSEVFPPSFNGIF